MGGTAASIFSSLGETGSTSYPFFPLFYLIFRRARVCVGGDVRPFFMPDENSFLLN